MNWSDLVHEYVKGIPKGKVASYATIAAALDNPGAARSVGTCMRKNFDKEIPCHRVIKSDRSLGQYNRGGALAKRALLEAEGVVFDEKGRVESICIV